MTLAAASRKPAARAQWERPFAKANDASTEARFRHPVSLREYLREFRDAVASDTPTRLHQRGVEVEADGGSAIGTPRWTHAFRTYISGSALAVHPADGHFRTPLRASLTRMAYDRRSAITRTSAAYLFLLIRHDDFTEAWRELLGIFAEDEFVAGTAPAQAAESLRRWWIVFTDTERPAYVGTAEHHCDYATPNCPHGRRLV